MSEKKTKTRERCIGVECINVSEPRNLILLISIIIIITGALLLYIGIFDPFELLIYEENQPIITGLNIAGIFLIIIAVLLMIYVLL